MLRYRVSASQPASHVYEVSIDVPALPGGDLRLRLPAWIPGSYMVRDYARHVMSLAAEDLHAAPLAVTRIAKSEWSVAVTGNEPVSIILRVYGWDLSVRGAHLDQHHAYFNGACLFPQVLGYDGDIAVEIDTPVGLGDDAWVATSMHPVRVDSRGFGEYRVADYDELLDHPVEIADQQCIAFDAAGFAHRFIVRDAPEIDARRLSADCEAICNEHHALLGTPADFDRYTFLAYALDSGYGGLEHRWSSSLAVSRADLPLRDSRLDADAYRKFLGLVSHEYFHLWNVRRLKPAAFTPLDLTREVDDYLLLVGQMLTRVYRAPGRHVQSLEDSSFDAWTKFYKQDENSANSIVSYYAKGALAALALDMKLRGDSDTTLDAVMRECWQRFYVADGSGMPERGLEHVAAELSGLDLGDFFDALIRGTDDIDLAELLVAVGIEMKFRPSAGANDKGGQRGEHLPISYAGFGFDGNNSDVVSQVLTGGPAQLAGLSAGDRLLAVDGIRTGREQFEQLLTSARPGAVLRVHAFRRDRLIELDMTLTAPPKDAVWLRRAKDPDDAAKRRFESWMASLCA